ncbi:hypothetical protein C3432_03125 [Citrobacter amalonaticus]|uniref:Channel forming colicins domain-containing protein n=1 Tax=Citrobacter amalonaticus TaxID=35703 RepID=A0A2S4S368_CITAM|nr:colicin-like pore-forming protein [Citrobacter amalonaticus]POT59722.1 hypothetical protein C3432_03125 [Citrobacter amalonaticus]POT77852.1 hypothetical protein C3436_10795 [Citrobacter amalonaticus]POU68304.1 hypothetical protein C3430_04330 [Citrobacter amalonaticus]POV07907.1 hypothetical protein C3424_04340 [Citrobacter amalonaticus]
MVDETNYNNGVPPQTGLVWSGVSWGWPTNGSWGNDTLTVWPKNNNGSIQNYIELITESGKFDPLTGNGWKPSVDGMWEFSPQKARKETINAVNKIKNGVNAGQPDILLSVDFWSFKVAPSEVTEFTSINPVVTILPAELMTGTKMNINSAAPKSIKVHSRILDDVHDGKQFLSVVGAKGNSYNLPVIQAKQRGKNFYVGRMPGLLGFLEFYINNGSVTEQQQYYLASSENGQLRQSGATVGERTDDIIVWFPKGSNRTPVYVSFTRVLTADGLAKRNDAEKKANDEIQKAIKATADFYKELAKRFGEQQSKIALELADGAKGKRIRSADEAMAAFNKYKASMDKKFSVKDRQAIGKALESIDRNLMASSLAKFSKGLAGVSYFIDEMGLVNAFINSNKTGDWRQFFVKAEVLGAGMAASAFVAFTFAALTASPLGILGFSLIMFLTGALIDDKLMRTLHDKLFL